MSKFACKLKIRSTQEDRRWQIKYSSWFQNKLIQGIATCYSINHRAFKRSDISLAPVFSFALKSTKATVINGLLSRMLLKVSSKFVEKVSNSSCVWLGDLWRQLSLQQLFPVLNWNEIRWDFGIEISFRETNNIRCNVWIVCWYKIN